MGCNTWSLRGGPVQPSGKLPGRLAVFTSSPHIQAILASGRYLDGYSVVQVAVEPLWAPFKAGLWNLCGEGDKNLPTLKWKENSKMARKEGSDFPGGLLS